jgi:RNase P protein component
MAGLIFLAFLWAFIAGAVWLVTGYARISLWVIVKVENAVQRRRVKRDLPPD